MKMTLQEAIDHLNESLNDPNREWCEECRQEHEQLLHFLIELKGFRAKAENSRISILSSANAKERKKEQNKTMEALSEAWTWQARYNKLLLEQMKKEKEAESRNERINDLEKTLQRAQQWAEFMRGKIAAYEKILFRLPWLITDNEGGDNANADV